MKKKKNRRPHLSQRHIDAVIALIKTYREVCVGMFFESKATTLLDQFRVITGFGTANCMLCNTAREDANKSGRSACLWCVNCVRADKNLQPCIDSHTFKRIINAKQRIDFVDAARRRADHLEKLLKRRGVKL